MNLLKSWKTLIAGIALIATGIITWFNGGDHATAIGLVIGGIGLIFAKDANVTGGSTPQ